MNLQRRDQSGESYHTRVVVAALAAEAEVAEAVEEKGVEGVAESGTVTVSKPKKGKAALPLKRDRVCGKKNFELLVILFWFCMFFGDRWVLLL